MKITAIIFFAFLGVALGRVGFGPGEQEWGYVDVRPGAHMFWWLYYTTANVASVTERPLIIWLQGGPGASGTGYGNFAELGPLDLDLNPRNYTWVKDANVLFIDNPVGSGFSYVDSEDAYTTDNRQIAEDLVELMRQFYAAFPEFKTVPLHITSESYGAKMTAEFAWVFYEAVQAGTIEGNLVSIGLGDGWVSPLDSVLTWAPYLLQVGAVDQAGHDAVQEAALECQRLFEAGDYIGATNQWSYTEYVILNVAHNIDFYNILEKIPAIGRTPVKSKNGVLQPVAKPATRDVIEDMKLEAIMNGPGGVRETLNLTQVWGAQSGPTFDFLAGDFMKPVTDIVESLLNNTDIFVAVYSGQLDLICDTPGTVIWVDNLKWPGAAEWATAERPGMAYNGIYEGYTKEVGNLGMYWVNRAGHMVPADNPNAMDWILRRITSDYAGRKN